MATPESSKKSFWKKDNAKIPGRPQQVHRSHEPLNDAKGHATGQAQNVGGVPRPRSKTFEEYEKETSDLWDARDEDLEQLTHSAELEVVPEFPAEDTQPKHNKPTTKLKTKNVPGELKTFFTDVVKAKASPRLRSRSGPERSKLKVKSLNEQELRRLGEEFDPPDRETVRLQKFGKLLAGPNTDIDELRKSSWSGVPPSVRATTWQILCGYLPANIDRREETLKRKRKEYQDFVERYYPLRSDPQHLSTFRQISIDVPRMNPDIPLFQQKIVQECFERILFIWSMRHPASGYVQGINDLVTPFFVVFLSYYICEFQHLSVAPHFPPSSSCAVAGDKNPECYEVSKLSEETLRVLEADSFWCMQKLMDGIQDNYTLAQPGIQTKIMALNDLMKRIDQSLNSHLSNNSVEYIQFAFRWFNNLLMRELPLRCVIRLWDSYLSEKDGFAHFHIYVCAALLAHFSKQIQSNRDFQDIMLFLQNLPTSKWRNDDIELLLAEAFQLKFMFADAPGHLTVQRTS